MEIDSIKLLSSALEVFSDVRTVEMAQSDLPEGGSGVVSSLLNDYLEASDGSEDLNVRKIFATAALIAKETGVLPDFPDKPQEVASILDDTLLRIKSSYQVAVGELSPEEALNSVIDAAEVRALTAIDIAFDRANQFVTDAIINGSKLIPYLGPVIAPTLQSYRPVISAFIYSVEEPARALIKNGIKKVAGTAKKVVAYVSDKIREKVPSLMKMAKTLSTVIQ